MFGDPFINLIVYLLLAALAIFALRTALTQAETPQPWSWIAVLVGGLFLVYVAFVMSGVTL